MEIYLTSKDLDPDTLIDKLENTPEWQSQHVQLILRKKPQAFRFLDPTIVVAIISAAGAGLTALITGVLALAKEAKSQRIIIHGQQGQVEFPADCSIEKIKEIEEVLHQMKEVKIEIS